MFNYCLTGNKVFLQYFCIIIYSKTKLFVKRERCAWLSFKINGTCFDTVFSYLMHYILTGPFWSHSTLYHSNAFDFRSNSFSLVSLFKIICGLECFFIISHQQMPICVSKQSVNLTTKITLAHTYTFASPFKGLGLQI